MNNPNNLRTAIFVNADPIPGETPKEEYARTRPFYKDWTGLGLLNQHLVMFPKLSELEQLRGNKYDLVLLCPSIDTEETWAIVNSYNFQVSDPELPATD